MENALSKKRVLDGSGKLMIPRNYKRVLKIDENTVLAITLGENEIIIKKEERPHESNIPYLVALDSLGRVTIPKQYRHALNMTDKQKIDIRVEANYMVLTKLDASCVICESKQDIMFNSGFMICKNCLSSFREVENV